MDQIVCGIRRHCDAGFFRTPSAEMEQKNMEQYATQMEAARKGIVTEELKKVAAKERMTTEELMPLVAEGKVVICANRHHKCIDPEGVGSMLRTKINVNLGISRDCKDYDVEMEKVMAAVDMGAHAIMDLSSHGNTIPFRRKLTAECPAMIGTVPVYDSVIHYQRDLATLTAKDFIDVVRLHAEDGVDFVTLHCGITRKTIEQIRKHKRKMNIVSRGGSLVFAWMCMTGEENPFYEYYDEILEICREHDVTISLGDACRPGCLADASDVCQIEELVRLGELTKRAWARDVQVMVEGPGHMPMDQIAANMKIQQTICMGAPFYVLGPLVTDIAPGYDHITSAIGGAIAAQNGAAFLCYVHRRSIWRFRMWRMSSRVSLHRKLRRMRQTLPRACGVQERLTTRWQTHAVCWTGMHSGNVRLIPRPQNKSARTANRSTRTPVPCAENSVRCAA